MPIMGTIQILQKYKKKLLKENSNPYKKSRKNSLQPVTNSANLTKSKISKLFK